VKFDEFEFPGENPAFESSQTGYVCPIDRAADIDADIYYGVQISIAVERRGYRAGMFTSELRLRFRFHGKSISARASRAV